MGLPRRELVEPEILEQVDAVDDQHDLVDRTGEGCLSGFGEISTPPLSAPTNIGSCLASHSAAAMPSPGPDALIARVVLAPLRAPAGVNEHRVTGLQRQLLLRQRLLKILRRDLVGLGEHRDAA